MYVGPGKCGDNVIGHLTPRKHDIDPYLRKTERKTANQKRIGGVCMLALGDAVIALHSKNLI